MDWLLFVPFDLLREYFYPDLNQLPSIMRALRSFIYFIPDIYN